MQLFLLVIVVSFTVTACSTNDGRADRTAMSINAMSERDETLAAMAEAIGATAQFLARQGDAELASRMSQLQASADRGDPESIRRAVSEATGGMGSLSDRQLRDASDNARLQELVGNVERTARAAAESHGLNLVR